ncbi:MAG: penicillin-binding protein 2 [Synergistales bacterium]|nr:penicillin-binding protein 2 [Synergistales bacterium]
MDIHDRVLAISTPSYSFFIDPKFWDPQNAGALSGILPEDKIERLSQKMPGRYYSIARKMDIREGEKIMNLELPGLYSINEKKRLYPNDTLSGHILGFCDIDDKGLSGIEMAWDRILYSPPEVKSLIKDASGVKLDLADLKNIDTSTTTGSVKLNIDSRLQYIVEKRLEQGIGQHRGKWGSVICMDPDTGAVLAMASWPTFDPNIRSSLSKTESLMNNSVGRVYEPGSTFKPVIVGIALEENLVRRNEKFTCPRKIRVADKFISDPKAYGLLDLEDVIVKSSNVGMSQIGIRFDAHSTYETLLSWGFGKITGIELTGTEEGLVPPPDQWRGVVPANIAIGQGIAITPLHLLMAISAIANGGSLLRPSVVFEAFDDRGQKIYSGEKRPITRVLSEETARWLRSAMRKVVTEGTGTRVNSDLVEIAGKTGTAQVAVKGQYKEKLWVSSFVGFWPYENPQYSMIVVIGEPSMGEYYGGSVAGPVFKNIVEDFIRVNSLDTI